MRKHAFSNRSAPIATLIFAAKAGALYPKTSPGARTKWGRKNALAPRAALTFQSSWDDEPWAA